MTKALDEQLCAEFPLIFRDRHADMRQTAMCWGFECGDGWYPLIRHLCLRLTHKLRTVQESYDCYASWTPEELAASPEWLRAYASPDKQAERLVEITRLTALVPVASQVKEKYGHLRFYVHGCTDEDAAIIREVEAMSAIVCEVCGMTAGTKTYTDGWHQTLCPTCAEIEGRKEMSDEDGDE